MNATGLHESLVAGTKVLPVLCIKKVGWTLDVTLGIEHLGLSLGALIVHFIDCPFIYGNDRSYGDRTPRLT